MNLSSGIKITRVLNAVAAGTTNQTGTHVDMQNYDGVMFIALFGALTATQVTKLKAQQGDDAADGDQADIAGSLSAALADADGNKSIVLDIAKPLQRYIRPVITRLTANAVIDGIVAIQYSGDKKPSVNDVSVALAKLLISPAQGAA